MDRIAWIKSVRDMHKRYHGKERNYWEAKIETHADQPKRLWATFNALLGRGRADRSQSVPSFSGDESLTSFTTKVFNIRKDTDGSPRQFFLPQLSTCPLSLLYLLLNYAVSSLNLLRNHVNSTPYLPPSCKSSSTSFFRF